VMTHTSQIMFRCAILNYNGEGGGVAWNDGKG
jgi:hypothetical protein